MGRLWQTLILSQWRPVLAYLPVEAVIREEQDAYYSALSAADRKGESTPFVEYMLHALNVSLREAIANESASDLVNDSVNDLVARLLLTLGPRSLRISDLMAEMSLVHKATFRSNYLKPALTAGMIEMTDPQSPKNPTQKYRLTQLGKMMVKKSQC